MKRRSNETTEVTIPCINELKLRGCLAWRNNTGAAKIGDRFVRFGVPGLPDILGVLPGGRMLAVECKRPKNKPTEEQLRVLEQLRAHGAAVAVVTDPAEIAPLMEEWARGASGGAEAAVLHGVRPEVAGQCGAKQRVLLINL